VAAIPRWRKPVSLIGSRDKIGKAIERFRYVIVLELFQPCHRGDLAEGGTGKEDAQNEIIMDDII
jgi:hypothetical protein